MNTSIDISFRCNRCDFQTTKVNVIQAHLKQSGSLFDCFVCEKVFCTEQILEQHYQQDHDCAEDLLEENTNRESDKTDEKIKTESDTELQMDQLGHDSESKESKAHSKESITSKTDGLEPIQKVFKPSDLNKRVQRDGVICAFCGEYLGKKTYDEKVKLHMSLMHPMKKGQKFHCVDCDKLFHSYTRFATHRDMVHNIRKRQPVQCGHCLKLFHHRTIILGHIRR